jgi:hypothetical protein
MRWLVQGYKLVNMLSIDVAIGAVVSALFFAKLLNVQILPYGIAALGLTVWIIYTVDHLRDAKKVKGQASSERHRFHQKHFRSLVIAVGIASVIDAVLILFIRKPVFIGGIALTVFVALYLLVQSRLFFLKESFVALLYTLGVLLPSIAVTDIEPGFLHLALIAQFVVIAELNLLLFSLFDYEADKHDNLTSFATAFGKNVTTIRIVIEFMLLFGIAITQLFLFGITAYQVILLLSSITLLVIFIFRDSFKQHALYRLVGDAVFFFPALIFLYE